MLYNSEYIRINILNLTYLDNLATILPYSSQPLSSQVLLHLYKDYKRPHDKISELVNQGILVQLRRGLYVPGAQFPIAAPEPFLIANHLYGPSYVSFDNALHYWGLIPERVVEVISATTLNAKSITTSIASFSYINLTTNYYAMGIQSHQLTKNQVVMLATPEKALMDKIIDTSMLQLRSVKQVAAYLHEDLRMETSDLKNFDANEMSSWIKYAPKKNSLLMLVNYLQRL